MAEQADTPEAGTRSPIWERTRILIGEAGVVRLQGAHVFLAGLGGVGSFAAEGLARAGIGRLTLADFDLVASSNLNRQLVALRSTLGRRKIDVMAERIRDINPECRLTLLDRFLHADELDDLLAPGFHFVLDAIDSLNSKLALLQAAWERGIPAAASMGAGGRTDPSRLRVGDLLDSDVCPLAREVRRRLRRRGVGRGITVVWSDEKARPPLPPEPTGRGRPRAINGTVSYLPALFGMTLAGVVVHRLLDGADNLPHGRG
jgi:tRNA A37 threonylcarbamoyladenosine dehydratase